MRRQFFAGISVRIARLIAPWAAKIVKVDGGSMAFESIEDYRVWRQQR
jgi:hypothetical protein